MNKILSGALGVILAISGGNIEIEAQNKEPKVKNALPNKAPHSKQKSISKIKIPDIKVNNHEIQALREAFGIKFRGDGIFLDDIAIALKANLKLTRSLIKNYRNINKLIIDKKQKNTLRKITSNNSLKELKQLELVLIQQLGTVHDFITTYKKLRKKPLLAFYSVYSNLKNNLALSKTSLNDLLEEKKNCENLAKKQNSEAVSGRLITCFKELDIQSLKQIIATTDKKILEEATSSSYVFFMPMLKITASSKGNEQFQNMLTTLIQSLDKETQELIFGTDARLSSKEDIAFHNGSSGMTRLEARSRNLLKAALYSGCFKFVNDVLSKSPSHKGLALNKIFRYENSDPLSYTLGLLNNQNIDDFAGIFKHLSSFMKSRHLITHFALDNFQSSDNTYKNFKQLNGFYHKLLKQLSDQDFQYFITYLNHGKSQYVILFESLFNSKDLPAIKLFLKKYSQHVENPTIKDFLTKPYGYKFKSSIALQSFASGDQKIIDYILKEAGVKDLNTLTTQSGVTALHMAAKSGNLELFNSVLKKFPNKQEIIGRPFYSQYRTINIAEFAIKGNNPKILKRILEFIDPKKKDLFLMAGKLNAKNKSEDLLHVIRALVEEHAANLEMAKLVMENITDTTHPEFRDALMAACNLSISFKQPSMLDFMLSKLNDKEIIDQFFNHKGSYRTSKAIGNLFDVTNRAHYKNDLEIIKTLLKHCPIAKLKKEQINYFLNTCFQALKNTEKVQTEKIDALKYIIKEFPKNSDTREVTLKSLTYNPPKDPRTLKASLEALFENYKAKDILNSMLTKQYSHKSTQCNFIQYIMLHPKTNSEQVLALLEFLESKEINIKKLITNNHAKAKSINYLGCLSSSYKKSQALKYTLNKFSPKERLELIKKHKLYEAATAQGNFSTIRYMLKSFIKAKDKEYILKNNLIAPIIPLFEYSLYYSTVERNEERDLVEFLVDTFPINTLNSIKAPKANKVVVEKEGSNTSIAIDENNDNLIQKLVRGDRNLSLLNLFRRFDFKSIKKIIEENSLLDIAIQEGHDSVLGTLLNIFIFDDDKNYLIKNGYLKKCLESIGSSPSMRKELTPFLLDNFSIKELMSVKVKDGDNLAQILVKNNDDSTLRKLLSKIKSGELNNFIVDNKLIDLAKQGNKTKALAIILSFLFRSNNNGEAVLSQALEYSNDKEVAKMLVSTLSKEELKTKKLIEYSIKNSNTYLYKLIYEELGQEKFLRYIVDNKLTGAVIQSKNSTIIYVFLRSISKENYKDILSDKQLNELIIFAATEPKAYTTLKLMKLIPEEELKQKLISKVNGKETLLDKVINNSINNFNGQLDKRNFFKFLLRNRLEIYDLLVKKYMTALDYNKIPILDYLFLKNEEGEVINYDTYPVRYHEFHKLDSKERIKLLEEQIPQIGSSTLHRLAYANNDGFYELLSGYGKSITSPKDPDLNYQELALKDSLGNNTLQILALRPNYFFGHLQNLEPLVSMENMIKLLTNKNKHGINALDIIVNSLSSEALEQSIASLKNQDLKATIKEKIKIAPKNKDALSKVLEYSLQGDINLESSITGNKLFYRMIENKKDELRKAKVPLFKILIEAKKLQALPTVPSTLLRSTIAGVDEQGNSFFNTLLKHKKPRHVLQKLKERYKATAQLKYFNRDIAPTLASKNSQGKSPLGIARNENSELHEEFMQILEGIDK